MYPFLPLLASIWDMKIWYGLPLVVAVCLVYAATRHEDMGPIFKHAARTAVYFIAFFAVFFAVLYLIGWWL